MRGKGSQILLLVLVLAPSITAWAVDDFITVDRPNIRSTSRAQPAPVVRPKTQSVTPSPAPVVSRPAEPSYNPQYRSYERPSAPSQTQVYGAPARPSVGRSSGEESVDLNSMDSTAARVPRAASGAPQPSGSSTQSVHANFGSLAQPIFKVYFDFLLHSRQGYTEPTFDNYHSLVLMEIVPNQDIQFGFELASNPRYYELDYKLTRSLELRMGKIWVPFDDMAPHNIYGGKVNTSKLAPGIAFLPNIWSDLGVGLRWHMIDTSALAAKFDLYVVNGFRGGGTNPKNAGAGASANYPDFSDLVTQPDNNKDKAIGGRAHFLFGRTFGVGTSFYTARWSNQALAAYRMNMLGLDTSLRLRKTELRAGLVTMFVRIPGDRLLRAGAYGEIGQRLDRKDQWKAMLRTGVLQMDDRVVDRNDQRIIGASILYRPNMVEFSLLHQRDLQKVATKIGYHYTAFRVVMAF